MVCVPIFFTRALLDLKLPSTKILTHNHLICFIENNFILTFKNLCQYHFNCWTIGNVNRNNHFFFWYYFISNTHLIPGYAMANDGEVRAELIMRYMVIRQTGVIIVKKKIFKWPFFFFFLFFISTPNHVYWKKLFLIKFWHVNSFF